MAAHNGKPKRSSAPLYRAAKISDYRFRKVLAQFVADATVAEAAAATGLSANSVAGIFRKLRTFFFEAGLFTDIYGGADPTTHWENEPQFEKALLEFHFGRVRRHRGLPPKPGEPDYHFAESHWRYHFEILKDQRGSDQVEAMMLAHLSEIIRLCRPVGGPPRNRRAGYLAVIRQMDQRIAWLERNAAGFSSLDLRNLLAKVRRL